MAKQGQKIINSLKDFAERLERGEPIKATLMRRVRGHGGLVYSKEEVELVFKPATPKGKR